MADRTNNSQISAEVTQGVKLVASAGTAEPLAASETLVESVEIEGKKAKDTNNTGTIYLGTESAQLKAIAAGGIWAISAPVGKKIDLAKIYIDAATSGDGVVYHAIN